MANLKNITDLPLAESTEGLNLIVNDNGAAKQIAADEVGAQADWAVTDENNPAFIKNKPEVSSKAYYIDDSMQSYIVNEEVYNALLAFNNDPTIGFPNITIKNNDGYLCKVFSVRHVSDEGGNYTNLNGFRVTIGICIGGFISEKLVIALTQNDANGIEGNDMA